MSTFATRHVAAALQRKGFVLRESHHSFFHFLIDGKDVGISTKISRGEREIDDSLASRMRKQMKLGSSQDFRRFVDCPISLDEYVALRFALRADKIVCRFVPGLSNAMKDVEHIAGNHIPGAEKSENVREVVAAGDLNTGARDDALRKGLGELTDLDERGVRVVENIALCKLAEPDEQLVVLREEGEVR